MTALLAARALFLLFATQGGIFSPHGESAVVLLFIRSDCPISNRYAPELQRLYRTYSSRAVDFLLVYPEPNLTAEAMKAHERDYGYTIPAVLDGAHEYVNRAGASVTPEAAVFVKGKLVYRGRIDDWYADIGRSRSAPLHHDLDDAIAAILGGRAPAVRETPAIGCAIESLR